MYRSTVLPSPQRRGPARIAIATTLLTVALAPIACKRSSSPASGSALAPSGAADPSSTPEAEVVATTDTSVTIVVTDLPAIFGAVEALSERWLPDGKIDLQAQLEAVMLALGYPPRLWEQVDPAGPHAMYAHGTAAEATVAFSVRVTDPARLAETMGAQPDGDERWLLKSSGGPGLVLQADDKRLDLGSSSATIDELHRRVPTIPGSHNVRVRFDDAASLFRDRAGSGPPRMDRLFTSMRTLDWSADLRPDADLVSVMTATYDALHESGFVGTPTTEPTTLARRVGHGAFAVITASVPKDLGPLRELADSAKQRDQLDAITAVLSAAGEEAVFAAHADGGSHVTVVAGIDVGDADRLRSAIVGPLGAALVDAGATHQTAKIGGSAADVWTLPWPDAKEFGALVVDKGKLTVMAVVEGSMAIVAAGPGAKKQVAASLRAPKSAAPAPTSSLAGLAQLQRSLDGCQLCIAIAPAPALRYLLRVLEDGEGSDTALDPARKLTAVVGKLDRLGAMATGLRLDEQTLRLGWVVPRAVAFAPVKDARALSEAIAKLGKFEGGEVVEQTTRFADQLCACQDMDCAQRVTKEMAAWAEAHKDAQGTERQAQQIEAQTMRIMKCMTDLAGRTR